MSKTLLALCFIACQCLAQSDFNFTEQLFQQHYNRIQSLSEHSPHKALIELDKVINLYGEHLSSKQRLKFIFIKARNQITQQQIAQAFNSLSQYKQLIDELNLTDELYQYYSLSASAFEHLAMFNLAMANYLAAYELALSIDDIAKVTETQSNVGLGFVNLNRLQEAGYFFDIVAQTAQQTKDPIIHLNSLLNYGVLYLHQQKYTAAIEQFQQALNVDTSIVQHQQHTQIYYWLAKTLLAQEQYPQTKQALASALASLTTRRQSIIQAKINLVAAELAIAEQEYQSALTQLDLLEKIARQQNFFAIIGQVLLLKSASYQALNDTNNSLTALESYIENQNDLEQLRSKVGLSHYIAQIELASKELDIIKLKQEKAIVDERANTNKLLIIVVSCASILVIIITLVFLFINRNKNKQLLKFINKLRSTQQALVASENMSAMTTLVSGMAHQLNTPLSIVITANSILKDKILELEQELTKKTLNQSSLQDFIEQSIETLQLTEKNSTKVASLISRFKLISSKLEGSEANKFAVIEFLSNKMILLRQQFHQKFSYTISGNEVSITNYPDVLLKTLEQLVENSCYHGVPATEKIHISLDIVEQPTQIEIHYQDNGKGIEPEKINQIFNPFFTTNSMQESLGLGMNIVYNSIVELMQGSIRCQMSAHGANFFISLPKQLRTVKDNVSSFDEELAQITLDES